MSFCHRLDRLLFPYDFSSINNRGKYLSPIQYTIFRFGVLVLIAVAFSYVVYYYRSEELLMFTAWGLIISLICATYMFVENLVGRCVPFSTKNYWKGSHFIFTLALCFELFINGVYWLAIYPYSYINLWGKQSTRDISLSVMAHVVPLAILILDLQMNLIVCWNFAYLPFFVLLLFCYLIVNCVYSLRQRPVYSEIDYKNWLTYVFLIGCAIGIVVCLFLLRLFCKFCKEDSMKRMLVMEEKMKMGRMKIGSQVNLMKMMGTPRYGAPSFEPTVITV